MLCVPGQKGQQGYGGFESGEFGDEGLDCLAVIWGLFGTDCL